MVLRLHQHNIGYTADGQNILRKQKVWVAITADCIWALYYQVISTFPPN